MVQPSLEISPAGAGVLIEARLLAAEPRGFEWRLVVDTRGAGGRSRVAQAGLADGADRYPLAQVRAGSPGEAELEVFMEGRLVARLQRVFDLPDLTS
jgi:hypothetical protein